MRVTKWISVILCVLVMGVGTGLWADDATVDSLKIEKTTVTGTKVTVVEGMGEKAEAKVAAPVAVAAPESSGAGVAHKARLAVLPAVYSEHFKPVLTITEKIVASGQSDLTMLMTTDYESRMESPSFTLSMVEAFVASRKFDVLERGRINETLDEITFGQSEYGDMDKVVPMGKALNAEYVVLPEVELIHIVQDVKEIPYVGRSQPRLKGKMIARLRVVDTAATKIVAASKEEVQVELKLKAGDPFLATAPRSVLMNLYEALALRMLHRTLETVYPVRMLEVKDGQVVLNRGQGAISVGDEFDVFSLGKAYVDPDTGESLGQSETRIASIQVTRVSPKFSEARILEGEDQLSGGLKAYICRESSRSIESKTKVKTAAPITW